MVTKGFEGGLPERRAPIQESVQGKGKEKAVRTQRDLQPSFSGWPSSRARDVAPPSRGSPVRGEGPYPHPHFNIWMTWISWMNKQYCRWEWGMTRDFSMASAIWKGLQATELWQRLGSQEPAGYSHLTDKSLQSAVPSRGRKIATPAMLGGGTEPRQPMSYISSCGLCRTHTAFAGVRGCQPNEGMTWSHPKQEQVSAPCICCHPLSTLPLSTTPLRNNSTRIPGAKMKGRRGQKRREEAVSGRVGTYPFLGLTMPTWQAQRHTESQ